MKALKDDWELLSELTPAGRAVLEAYARAGLARAAFFSMHGRGSLYRSQAALALVWSLAGSEIEVEVDRLTVDQLFGRKLVRFVGLEEVSLTPRGRRLAGCYAVREELEG